ncbi:hypothetical protein AWENTII_008868 [Aspergillus wentii]|nr:hypothetical protein MW887_004518 [Aspergillus wentii]
MVCVAKLSLLTIYYRLDPLGVFWKVYIYSISVILVIPSVVLVILYIFGCRPLQMAWDSTITDGHCVDRLTILLTSSVFNVITDFLMIIAPIPLVWDLQMRPLHKVGVVLMFFLGCITIITSIFRVITVHHLLWQSDHPYHMATPILWANAETVLIIICDCLPSFRIFLRHHFPSDSETESGSLTRTPQSNTQNPTDQELRSWFDDDIELIRNSGQTSDPTVVGRTINMDLQYTKFITSVTVHSGNDRDSARV